MEKWLRNFANSSRSNIGIRENDWRRRPSLEKVQPGYAWSQKKVFPKPLYFDPIIVTLILQSRLELFILSQIDNTKPEHSLKFHSESLKARACRARTQESWEIVSPPTQLAKEAGLIMLPTFT